MGVCVPSDGGLLIFRKVLWVMRNGYMVFIGVQVLRVGIYGYACIYVCMRVYASYMCYVHMLYIYIHARICV